MHVLPALVLQLQHKGMCLFQKITWKVLMWIFLLWGQFSLANSKLIPAYLSPLSYSIEEGLYFWGEEMPMPRADSAGRSPYPIRITGEVASPIACNEPGLHCLDVNRFIRSMENFSWPKRFLSVHATGGWLAKNDFTFIKEMKNTTSLITIAEMRVTCFFPLIRFYFVKFGISEE